MKANVISVLALAAVSMQIASAQIAPETAETTSRKVVPPVAHIYVSSNKNGNKIYGFAAAPDGKLVEIGGSPFKADVATMAVNGKYLFGFGNDQTSIFSYLMEPSGALKLAATTNTAKYNTGGCPFLAYPLLDHTGATLYSDVDTDDMCEQFGYQSFRIDKDNGSLIYLGTSNSAFYFTSALSFIKNNVYAFGASCTNYENFLLTHILGYRRSSSGALEPAGEGATPDAPSGEGYCPFLTAADTLNHVAVSMQLFDAESPYYPLAPPKLATYTSDSAGNLTTTSTTANMPKVSVGSVNDMKMAPSGKLLAVAGTSGIQIFHFNGAEPIKLDTQLRTTHNINQLFWDNNDHLYAVSSPSGLLFVYSITPSAATEAIGSPYSIPGANSLIVQPK